MTYNPSELKIYFLSQQCIKFPVFYKAYGWLVGSMCFCNGLRVAKEFGAGAVSSWGPHYFSFTLDCTLVSPVGYYCPAPHLSHFQTLKILSSLRPPIGLCPVLLLFTDPLCVQLGKAWTALTNVFKTLQSTGHWVNGFGVLVLALPQTYHVNVKKKYFKSCLGFCSSIKGESLATLVVILFLMKIKWADLFPKKVTCSCKRHNF